MQIPRRARLGDLERAIMDRLWAIDPVIPESAMTVREIHESIAQERDIAYTTVMTVLDRLAKKGVVRQERADRAYRYAPVQTREEMTAALMLDALGATPEGPARDAALVHFVGRVGPEGAAALRAALDRAASA